MGENSPLKLNAGVIYQHIDLDKNAKYTVNIKSSMWGIIYLLKGELIMGEFNLKTDQALFIENRLTLDILTNENSEFMLCFGAPHNEPIHQYGQFVD